MWYGSCTVNADYCSFVFCFWIIAERQLAINYFKWQRQVTTAPYRTTESPLNSIKNNKICHSLPISWNSFHMWRYQLHLRECCPSPMRVIGSPGNGSSENETEKSISQVYEFIWSIVVHAQHSEQSPVSILFIFPSQSLWLACWWLLPPLATIFSAYLAVDSFVYFSYKFGVHTRIAHNIVISVSKKKKFCFPLI